jgi:uncharacterized protein (DUF2249 family)
MPTLDVRAMPPQRRHATIFETLDGLDVGEALTLVNDHDPVPLRYQLDATRPGQFGWTVVADGPETWEVEIRSRARVVDARPIIARGEEPFQEIMDAADRLGDDEVLVVLAPFEPVPLEGVLGEQGFSFAVDALDSGDWRVVFTRR